MCLVSWMVSIIGCKRLKYVLMYYVCSQVMLCPRILNLMRKYFICTLINSGVGLPSVCWACFITIG